jgi:predicted RNase H-like HicB family nuclease
MRYTVLLLPGEDPELYVAFVPGLDVVTQGEGVEGALIAAREACALAVKDMIENGEEILVERGTAIMDTIDVDVPVPAGATT